MADEYVESGGNIDGDEIPLDDFIEIGGDIIQQNIPDPALAYLYAHHPETILEYVEEIIPKLSISTNHKSTPYLTTFERTKILGFRATQLSQGARPFIKLHEHITDVKEIARRELNERRLPFILKRPMPDGTFEYWRLSDLLIM